MALAMTIGQDTKSTPYRSHSAFTLGVALWLLYGVLVVSWPIVIANAITLALASGILLMKIRFG